MPCSFQNHKSRPARAQETLAKFLAGVSCVKSIDGKITNQFKTQENACKHFACIFLGLEGPIEKYRKDKCPEDRAEPRERAYEARPRAHSQIDCSNTPFYMGGGRGYGANPPGIKITKNRAPKIALSGSELFVSGGGGRQKRINKQWVF